MSRKILEIISNRNPVTVSPGSTIRMAVEKMATAGVGTVLITKGSRLKGLFSERDLVRRVIAKGIDINTTPIDDVMTTNLATVGKNNDTKSCLELMLKMRCRSLPVVSFWKGTLGVVTLIDVLMDLTKQSPTIQGNLNDRSEGAPLDRFSKSNLLKDLAATQTIRTLTSQTDVLTAIKLMAAANIGSVLIVDNGKLVGVFSERDIILRVYGQHLSPEKVKLGEVMTHQIGVVDIRTPIPEVLILMKKLECRTLPIEDESKIIGVVSVINCLRWIYDEYQNHDLDRNQHLGSTAKV